MKFAQIAILGAAILLCSCASAGLDRVQNEESKHSIYDCSGIHLRNASWEFIDQYGQQVRVTGRCVNGMRHGNFYFYVEGVNVAKTKYIRNDEYKTVCLEGNKSYKVLEYCMKSYVEKTKESKNSRPVEESSLTTTQTTKSTTVTTQTTKYNWD